MAKSFPNSQKSNLLLNSKISFSNQEKLNAHSPNLRPRIKLSRRVSNVKILERKFKTQDTRVHVPSYAFRLPFLTRIYSFRRIKLLHARYQEIIREIAKRYSLFKRAKYQNARS